QALLPGSPAIDTGALACQDPTGTPLASDQRGVRRPIGLKCDLGAFEVEPIGDANGDGAVNIYDVLYLINYLFAAGPAPLGRSHADGNTQVNISDILYLINYIFANGPAPV